MDSNENSEKNGRKGLADTRKTLVAISLIREIGLIMIFSVLIGFFAGMYLDRWLSTRFLFLFIGAMVGMVSGFRMIYLLIMNLERRGDKRDEVK